MHLSFQFCKYVTECSAASGGESRALFDDGGAERSVDDEIDTLNFLVDLGKGA
jgi:hypothetical protein